MHVRKCHYMARSSGTRKSATGARPFVSLLITATKFHIPFMTLAAPKFRFPGFRSIRPSAVTMARRVSGSLSHWSSRLFAVDADPGAEPVYFALSKERPPEDPERRRELHKILGAGERTYSFHVCVEDRIQRALLHDHLRSQLTSALPRDASVLPMCSFRPGVPNSVVRGFFVNGVCDTPETERMLSRLSDSRRLAVCTYVPGEGGGRWCQYLLSATPGGTMTRDEGYSVVPVRTPESHPSTLDIVNSCVFYSLTEAYNVMVECGNIIPEAKQVLEQVDRRQQTRGEDRFPVIVIEGLDATGKSTLTESLKESLGGILLRSPPSCLAPLRATFDPKPALIRRAFFALGNYITANQITAESARGLVIVDRYWHSTAAYAIATAVSGKVDNLPGRGAEVYRWPSDLLKPDLVLLLTVSPEERLRRLTGRGRLKTPEETQLEVNQLFRCKVEEAYQRMEDPACVVVDANPSAEEVLQQVLRLIKDKFHL